MKRISFAIGITISTVLVMFGLWGGRPHPRAELGVGGWFWLWSSATCVLATPLWAFFYPHVARAQSGLKRIVLCIFLVMAAMVFSYLAGIVGLLLLD